MKPKKSETNIKSVEPRARIFLLRYTRKAPLPQTGATFGGMRNKAQNDGKSKIIRAPIY